MIGAPASPRTRVGTPRGFAAGLILLAAATLVACGPDDVADRMEPDAPQSIADADYGPQVFRERDGGIRVVLWGSSSCPAVATSFEVADDLLEVGFERSAGDACTDDLAPTSYFFDAERLDGAMPTEARVRPPDVDPVTVDIVTAETPSD